jgi:hypothetical protein
MNGMPACPHSALRVWKTPEAQVMRLACDLCGQQIEIPTDTTFYGSGEAVAGIVGEVFGPIWRSGRSAERLMEAYLSRFLGVPVSRYRIVRAAVPRAHLPQKGDTGVGAPGGPD